MSKLIPTTILMVASIALGIQLLPHPNPDTCVVNRIIDADTIICSQERIRFVTVSAAENNTGEGFIATQKLREVLPLGTEVALIPSSDGRTHDKYGRKLADIYIRHNAQADHTLQTTLKEVNTE